MKVIKIFDNGGRVVQDHDSPNQIDIDGKKPTKTVKATSKNIDKYIGRQKFDKMKNRDVKPQK